jgi:predicted lipoprotein with Yx(FWY)xxD motif
LGRILVGGHGRSLYLFEKDTGTASACYHRCAVRWPPLIVSGAPRAGAGVAASKLGTTRRSDGKTQVTYNGHPLYYYDRDKTPRQTKGEGLKLFGGGWDVLAPSGKKIEKPGG